MFDILVYLFENYYEFSSRPEPEVLTRKLTAAGFTEEEITEALGWLAGLKAEGAVHAFPQTDPQAIRFYNEEELHKLGSDCRGFLQFLQNAGVLSSELRELVIDRALALAEEPVDLSRFKVIVLMVLWSREKDLDTLIVEELLSDADPDLLH